MNVAYVRVSTAEQNEARQVEALNKFNIDKWYIEKVSAKNADRPQFKAMLEFVREGDTIYVHAFSRLARNTIDLLNTVKQLEAKNVKLISNKENLDTSTPTGKLMLTMVGAISEFERELILERQREGIAIAKEKGVYKGRKRMEYRNIPHFEILYQQYMNREISKVTMAKQCKVSRVVLDRLIQEYKIETRN